jgi:hypothetical protein
MEVQLTERQREYVLEYQRILNRLTDIQTQVTSLGEESTKLLEDLKALRAQEKEEFPDEDQVLNKLDELEADN